MSIYARKYGEWAELADWFESAKPQHKHVLFAIQFPRVYHVWMGMKAIKTFGELLTNFFGPLFEATAAPEKHVALAKLLSQIRCFDTVDNEAKEDVYFLEGLPPASEYDSQDNPPYSYYTFYFWYNMRALNALRQAKGMNTFKLRPHAGEAGPSHHLATTFLFANGISHGINLEREPVLQYLYYLANVPISVSPISNACLFLPYAMCASNVHRGAHACVSLASRNRRLSLRPRMAPHVPSPCGSRSTGTPSRRSSSVGST